MNFYEILEVPETATPEEIRTAYLRLALSKHPDKRADKAQAEEEFKQLEEAYGTLKDPDKRRAYDGALAMQRASSSRAEAARAESSHPERKPEEGGLEAFVELMKNPAFVKMSVKIAEALFCPPAASRPAESGQPERKADEQKGSPPPDPDETERQQALGKALVLSIKQAKWEEVNNLLKITTNFDVRDKDGLTSLHHLIQYKHYDAVASLLSRRADPNISEYHGQTPLFYAVHYKDFKACEILAPHSELNQRRNVDYNTALHLAIRDGAGSGIIECLINRSKTSYGHFFTSNALDLQDKEGNTALHLAIIKKDWPSVRLLLQKRINLTLKNTQGKRALDIVLELALEVPEDIRESLSAKTSEAASRAQAQPGCAQQ